MALDQSPGGNIGKSIVANSATNCLMRIISFVILAIIWGLAIFIFWKNNWYAGMSQNLRTVIIIAIFVIPIIIIAIIDAKLRKYFYKKI